MNLLARAYDFAAAAVERDEALDTVTVFYSMHDPHDVGLPRGRVREQTVVVARGQRLCHALEQLASLFRGGDRR